MESNVIWNYFKYYKILGIKPFSCIWKQLHLYNNGVFSCWQVDTHMVLPQTKYIDTSPCNASNPIYYFLANSITDWAQRFTYLLFYACWDTVKTFIPEVVHPESIRLKTFIINTHWCYRKANIYWYLTMKCLKYNVCFLFIEICRVHLNIWQ